MGTAALATCKSRSADTINAPAVPTVLPPVVNVTFPASALFTYAVSVPVVAVFALVTCVLVATGVVVATRVTDVPLATMFPPVLSFAQAANNGLVPWLAVDMVTLVYPLRLVGAVGFAKIVIYAVLVDTLL